MRSPRSIGKIRAFRDLSGTEIPRPAIGTGTSSFPVRIFRTPDGYLAWADGLGTVEGRTLSETRRAARRLVEAVVAGAFPDRPTADPTGTWEVLEFRLDVRLRLTGAGRRRPGGAPTSVVPFGPTRPEARRSEPGPATPRVRDASGASGP